MGGRDTIPAIGVRARSQIPNGSKGLSDDTISLRVGNILTENPIQPNPPINYHGNIMQVRFTLHVFRTVVLERK